MRERASTAALLGTALAVLGLALPAFAQDEWLAIRRVALSGHVPAAELDSGMATAGVPSGTPVRVVVTGTLTDGLDGWELDAVSRFTPEVRDTMRPPLHLPAGAHITHADTTAHRYEIEVPAGTDLRFALDIGGLASRHLVTATEMRGRLDGALEIELLVPRAAVMPQAAPTSGAPVVASDPSIGLTLGGVLGGFGLVFIAARRRRRSEDERLLARALRAHAAIGKKARALGPQFVGAIPPAGRLLTAVREGRDHLAAIDRALLDSAFVEGKAALTRRQTLRANRDAALARIARATGALEEAFVALGASNADRSAARDVERSLHDLAAEVDIGRAVDRELGLDSTG